MIIPFLALSTVQPAFSQNNAEICDLPFTYTWNPGQDSLSITFKEYLKQPLSIQVYDNQGYLILNRFQKGTENRYHNYNLDMSMIPPGQYTLRVRIPKMQGERNIYKP